MSKILKSTKKSGFNDQVDTYSISGRVNNDELTTIATIQVDAEDGKYFTEVPHITIGDSSFNSGFELNENIKLQLVSNTSNTNYTFKLKYRNTKSIFKTDNIEIFVKYKQKTIQAEAYEIRSVTFGKSTVNGIGGKRVVSVYGKPGASFNLMFNTIDEVKDSSGNVVNSTEKSIISKSNSSIYDTIGNEIAILSETLDSTGKYSFNQNIPSNVVERTAINGSMAASGATKIIFDSLANVRVGDQIIMKEITTGVITVTALNPDGDNENECTVSASITAADNAKASFKRSKKYRVYIEPSTSTTISTISNLFNWNLNNNFTGYYSNDINQYIDPVLTLRVSTSESAGVFTMNAATFNSDTPYDLTYSGKADTLQNEISGLAGSPSTNFTVTYLLDLVSGARNFAYVDTNSPKPRFSNQINLTTTQAVGSTTSRFPTDWTNTLPSKNGGTKINIKNIAITAAGANTVTLTMDVKIIKWGTKDVIMDLDIDRILSNS